jgi:peptidoglycan/xylan/chitin deacetylase (PgdA/CDA1 family)
VEAHAATGVATGSGATARVVWRGPRADRVVALTFDDGWSPAALRRIRDTLVREGVPATFFVTGMYVQRAPALWREIATRFPIANHSNRHRDTRELSDHAIIRDLVRTRAAVEAATGRRILPVFRPPYGSHDERTDRLAAAAGFPTIAMWSTSANDTIRPVTKKSVVRRATAGRPGAIVLLHAGPMVTARALPKIIERYRARGFRFVTLPELIGIQWPAAGTAAETRRAIDRAPAAAVAAREGASPAPEVAVAPAPAAPPAIPVPTVEPVSPARERAWARSDGTPGALAAGTVILLAGLLLVAVAAGRGRRREDEPAI